MNKITGSIVALGMIFACSTAMAAGGGCGGHGGGDGSDRTLSRASEKPALKQQPIFVFKDGGFVRNPDR